MADLFAAHPAWFLAAIGLGILLVRAAGPLWVAAIFCLCLVVALFSPAGLVAAGAIAVWAGARVAGGRIVITIHGDGNTINGPIIVDNSKETK